MKILELRTMRGPNYWSLRYPRVIVMKLDLEDLEREPTHQIDGFYQRLTTAIPTLQQHRCSKGYEGGFLEVVRDGTWMGHVALHIALELQVLAGMECSYGRCESTHQQGIYTVIFEYLYAEAGELAARSAVRIAAALAHDKPFELNETVEELKKISLTARPGPSTGALVAEAARRGIPARKVNDSSLYVLGHGVKQKRVRATVASTTSGIGIEIAQDKQETKQILRDAKVPVPEGVVVYSENELIAAMNTLKPPYVIKPLNGNHGRGITTGVATSDAALEAFTAAKNISGAVILEEYIDGDDYRLLVVNFKLIAVAKRTPALVTGDGKSTIAQLIEQVNSDPRRGIGHDDLLTRIEIDEPLKELLAAGNLTLDSVLPGNKTVILRQTANISTGGTARDVTDTVHPFNVALAERVARLIDLNVCGLDVLAKDLSQPLTRENGAIVEVNAGPGLRMHIAPSEGLPRNIAAPIIDMLFPKGENGRIPLVTVTGTNGKTTTTRMIAHLAKVAGGKHVGFTTTDGIYIGGDLIYSGDCTGPVSSETVLFDPTIEFAVLECARGGILRSGLAFDQCDIAVVTNVSEDHLGLKDINTIEEMAKVKFVLPATVHHNGYAILNADDNLVYEMRRKLSCKIALFSTEAGNERVTAHCRSGGLAAVTDQECLVVHDGKWKYNLGELRRFPVTLGGRAESMIRNILPAALAAWISGFDPKAVSHALRTFTLSAENTPGRMNIFRFPDFEMMVDYAHNPHGMEALRKFMDRTDAAWKVAVVGIAGDRRNEDIRMMGAIAAGAFDEIIVRHDVDLRGRNPGEMTALLLEGISSVKPEMPVQVIQKESDAVRHVITNAKKKSFVVVCSEQVSDTLQLINDLLRESNTRTARSEKMHGSIENVGSPL